MERKNKQILTKEEQQKKQLKDEDVSNKVSSSKFDEKRNSVPAVQIKYKEKKVIEKHGSNIVVKKRLEKIGHSVAYNP